MKKPDQMNPSERVAMLLNGVLKAQGEAMGCEDCYELLDRCAELVESGRLIEEDFPEVKKHLGDCVCCSQEFGALLTALGIKVQQEGASG